MNKWTIPMDYSDKGGNWFWVVVVLGIVFVVLVLMEGGIW